jgi:hypothetical protein
MLKESEELVKIATDAASKASSSLRSPSSGHDHASTSIDSVDSGSSGPLSIAIRHHIVNLFLESQTRQDQSTAPAASQVQDQNPMPVTPSVAPMSHLIYQQNLALVSQRLFKRRLKWP